MREAIRHPAVVPMLFVVVMYALLVTCLVRAHDPRIQAQGDYERAIKAAQYDSAYTAEMSRLNASRR